MVPLPDIVVTIWRDKAVPQQLKCVFFNVLHQYGYITVRQLQGYLVVYGGKVLLNRLLSDYCESNQSKKRYQLYAYFIDIAKMYDS